MYVQAEAYGTHATNPENLAPKVGDPFRKLLPSFHSAYSTFPDYITAQSRTVCPDSSCPSFFAANVRVVGLESEAARIKCALSSEGGGGARARTRHARFRGFKLISAENHANAQGGDPSKQSRSGGRRTKVRRNSVQPSLTEKAAAQHLASKRCLESFIRLARWKDAAVQVEGEIDSSTASVGYRSKSERAKSPREEAHCCSRA